MSDATIGTVQSKFVADTQQYDASIEGAEEHMKRAGAAAEQMGGKVIAAGEKVDRAFKLQEQAAERARRAWQREVQQQNQTIDSEQELARARELSALRADIFARSESSVAQAEASVAQAMHGTVPATAAASGAMRTLEGNFSHNIRAAERFMSTTLGLGPLLEKAFPVVGAIALGGVLFEMGDKAYEAFKKAQEAAKEAREEVEQLGLSYAQTNISLQVANDKLDVQISQLEKKPVNNLALALDEAREASIGLSTTLEKNIRDAAQLIDKTKIGFLTQTLHNSADSKDVTDELTNYQKDLRKIREKYRQPLADAKTPEERSKIQGQQDAEQRSTSNWYAQNARQHIKGIDASAGPDGRVGGVDFSGQRSHWEAVADTAESNSEFIGLSDAHSTKQTEADRLTAAKTNSDAAKKAAEAAKKVEDDALADLENTLKERQAAYNLGAGFTQDYWQNIKDTYLWGEDATRKIDGRIADAMLQNNARVTDKIHALQKAQKELGPEPAQGFKPIATSDSDITAMARLRLDHDKNAAQHADAMAQFSFADPHQQAMEQAERHAALYTQEIRELHAELSKLHQEDAFDPILGKDPARVLKETSIGNQIDALDNNAQLQSLQDHLKEVETTWKGMVGGVFDEIIRQSQNTVAEIKMVTNQFVAGSNDQMVNGMLGKKTNWSGVFGQAAHGVGKAGVEKVEGIGLDLLGLRSDKRDGKRDGQAADRGWYVTVTNEAALAKGGAGGMTLSPGLSGITGDSTVADTWGGVIASTGSAAAASGAGKSSSMGATAGSAAAKSVSTSLLGMLNDSDTASNLLGGHLFGSNSAFGGFRAAGGEVLADTPYVVGERGPELMIPGTSGSIVPNHQLASMGGSPVYKIDARGTDAAMVHQAVYRGMAMAHAQAVTDSNRSMRDSVRRTPR